MQCKVTPEMFWQFRYQQLGGKSAVTGDPLPATLAECNPGVQADHYAQACYAFCAYNLGAVADGVEAERVLLLVEVPRGVPADRATDIRRDAVRQHFADHGYYG